ncbi:MAG: hypothetical protein Q7S52_05815 [bacterium]|nr:hypothetical protein [bacterium]
MKHNKGFTTVAMILIILGVAVVVGMVYYAGKNNSQTISDNATPVLGGGCSYEEMKGECRIISIAKTQNSLDQKNSSGYEGFEVKFSFIPPTGSQNNINVNGFDLNDFMTKKSLLQLANSWYPGPQYLQKYNITEDAVFACTLKVESKGTCAPVVVDFDEVDTTDYFEK